MATKEAPFNLNTANTKELDAWAKQNSLSVNEKTVLQALQSVALFLDEKDFYYVRRNLEDALSYAPPRLKAMKKSVKEHLPNVGVFTIPQQKEWLVLHFEAFCKGVKA